MRSANCELIVQSTGTLIAVVEPACASKREFFELLATVTGVGLT